MKMNGKEKELFRSFHSRLMTLLRAEEMAPLLYGKGIISAAEQKKCLCQENIPNAKKVALLLPTVSKRCSMRVFLDCLNEAGFSFLCQDFEKQLKENSETTSISGNFKRQHKCNTSFTDVFAEKMKAKIHNAEARNFSSDIEHWAQLLLKTIHSDELKSLSELHQQADCCFILLDSLAVIARTHSPPQDLWKSNVYREMEGLISKTSNPLISRIRHHARYGVALYLGDQNQKALEYLDGALNDAKAFLFSGRDVGNCTFALVNYRLKLGADTNCRSDQIKTLNLIKEGIRYFEDEDEQIRQTWRMIYLDKKISCLLALEPSGRSKATIEFSHEDLQTARESLCEMEKQKNLLDKRRKIHFYQAKARLAEAESDFCIAEGYLKEAYKLCVDGGYYSELQIVKEKLGENLFVVDNPDSAMNDDSSNALAFDERLCSGLRVTDTHSLVSTCISDLARKLNLAEVRTTSSSKRKLSDSDEQEKRDCKKTVNINKL